MTIAITGSNGFVGRYLTEKLHDCDVLTINRSEGLDLTKKEMLDRVPSFDTLVHLAADTSIPESYNNPQEFYYNNIIGTLNALELCRKHNAALIFLSTAYVYGDPEHLPISESHPVKAVSPYSESKLIGEQLCKAYHRDFNVPVLIFRPFNIYGKGKDDLSIIPSIIRQAKSGNIELNNDRPKRDFVHVEDVATAIEIACKKRLEGFKVLNIGKGESYSIPTIINIIQDLLKTDSKVTYKNEFRPNDVLDIYSDNRQLKEEFSWEPKISLQEGIAGMI